MYHSFYRQNFFIKCNILEKFNKLNYITLHNIVKILLKLKARAIFVKKNQADTLCYITILINDWWFLKCFWYNYY